MTRDLADASADDLVLRDIAPDDIPIFFAHQLDAEANHMAAFTSKDPTNWPAFATRWDMILGDETVLTKTIVLDGHVVGHVLSYEQDGTPEVSYWIGKEYWGQGIATRALLGFLADVNPTRPIYARVAKDNIGSLRVLEKCGFTVIDEARGYAHARGAEIEEWILQLTGGDYDAPATQT
jgi:RimJ/RimL family protein N-acetyltransferase